MNRESKNNQSQSFNKHNYINMQRKLLECYCKEVLGIKQKILSYEVKGNEVYIVFLYDENYIYQDNIFISMLDVISFVFNRV